MAIYEARAGEYVSFKLIRAEDLLYLDAALGGPRLDLVLPTQHLMEVPAEPPVVARPTTMVGGGEFWNALRFVVDPAILPDDIEGLLTYLASESVEQRAEIEFPSRLHLRTHGPGWWDLHAVPRIGPKGWTAIWQGENRSAETSRSYPGGLFFVVGSGAYPDALAPWFKEPYGSFNKYHGALFEARMAVSMLGASARIHGPVSWSLAEPETPPLDAPEYAHHAQFGRDQAVQQVFRGFLSSGHAVSVTTTIDRAFTARKIDHAFPEETPAGYVYRETYLAAHLVKITTMTVLNPEVTLEGTRSPFRRLRLVGHSSTGIDAIGPEAAWVRIGGESAEFGIVATDWEGREIPFSTPLMYIPADLAYRPDAVAQMFTSGPPEQRRASLGGSLVALADASGNTTLPVASVGFELKFAPTPAGMAIMPTRADVVIEAVAMFGRGAGAVSCRLPDVDPPDPDHFVLIDPPIRLGTTADKVGGLASPDAMLSAVSRTFGAVPMGDLATAFADATLFGVPLVQFLDSVQAQPPTLLSRRLPDRLEAEYLWEPKLTKGPATSFLQLGKDPRLTLRALVVQPLGEARPVTTVSGELSVAEDADVADRPTVSVLGLVVVSFTSIRFESLPESAPSLRIANCKVEFGGDLRFVAELAERIPGFADDGPVVVDDEGITASLDVAIPDFGFGVFSLSNLHLKAGLTVPFTGAPARVRFAVAQRESPFTVAVSLFGGGGFFAITASTNGIETVEASFEFGGNFELDVVVATGHVYAMGGVYVLKDGANATVEGYLRCGGYLDILDIIGISVEFAVRLSYSDALPGRPITGSATVTVGIQVLLFSESVSFGVTKSFNTVDRASAIEDAGDPDAWDSYCTAFVDAAR